MVATLHPQVATITPQYAVPFTLSCAAGRPALVEQTAAVLVIPSLDCVTNRVPLVSFFFIFSCLSLFCFLLVSYFSKEFFFTLVFAESMEALCHLVAVFLLRLYCLIVFLLNTCWSTVWWAVWLWATWIFFFFCQASMVNALGVASEELQHYYLFSALLLSIP